MTVVGKSGSFSGAFGLSRVLIVVAVVVTAGWVPAARAGTVTVCQGGGCDYATIQAAVDAGSTAAGDTISVLDGVHTEAGILVDKSVTISGAGASETILQADDGPATASDRVLTIAEGVAVTIRDVTVRHGSVTGTPAVGGGILNHGRLTLERSAVTQNQVVGPEGAPGHDGSGGGIYNDGSLTIIRSTVSDNLAEGGRGSGSGADGGDARGGGIASSEDGELEAINCTISGNRAVPGSGYG